MSSKWISGQVLWNKLHIPNVEYSTQDWYYIIILIPIKKVHFPSILYIKQAIKGVRSARVPFNDEGLLVRPELQTERGGCIIIGFRGPPTPSKYEKARVSLFVNGPELVDICQITAITLCPFPPFFSALLETQCNEISPLNKISVFASGWNCIVPCAELEHINPNCIINLQKVLN